MGRKSKAKAKEHEEAAEANDTVDGTPPLVFSDDDDDDGNEDLSLKIVEKALRSRAAKLGTNETVLNGTGSVDSASQQTEPAVVQSDLLSGIVALEAMEEEKIPKPWEESEDQSVILFAEQEVEENIETTENHESVEASEVQMGDNMVLRKLLRGPRYFDPPDNSWGACYNCGEQGHNAVNCTAEKRKKPCYRCGGFGHNAKQCTKAQDCFICKKGGHRANKCPEKHMNTSKSMTVCLRCGNSGHDMFSCRNEYSADDLKEIQCYLCKAFGHLCCVTIDDVASGGISCYKCGQLGHTGLACSKLQGETSGDGTPNSCFRCGEEGHFARECTNPTKVFSRPQGDTNGAATPTSCYRCGEGGHFARECTNPTKASSRPQGETNGAATPTSCYRCGEGGHFARECTNSTKASSRPQGETNGAATPTSCYRCGEGGHFARECTTPIKAGRKNREFSNTKNRKSHKENDYMGHRSAPHDMGKKHKTKRPHTEEEDYTTPKKSKSRGGWTREHYTEERSFTTPKKSKQSRGGWTEDHHRHERDFEFQPHMQSRSRGGWTTEHPAEFSHSWRSPGTYHSARSNTNHSYGSATYHSAANGWKGQPIQGSNSQGPPRVFDNRYSASRFGNSSNDGHRSNWW